MVLTEGGYIVTTYIVHTAHTHTHTHMCVVFNKDRNSRIRSWKLCGAARNKAGGWGWRIDGKNLCLTQNFPYFFFLKVLLFYLLH